ncbi:MAG: phage holin family protein, partial [Rhizobiaceae bacterium]
MARRAKNAAVIYVVAGLCIAIGLGFFLAALFIWLADEFGSLWTALGFGAAFFLIAGIVLLIHAIRSKRASKIASERRRSSFATLAATAAASALPSI